LAESPEVWWYIAYRFLEGFQQDSSFFAGEIEVLHHYRGRVVNVKVDAKRCEDGEDGGVSMIGRFVLIGATH